jgi:hypothetical protein
VARFSIGAWYVVFGDREKELQKEFVFRDVVGREGVGDISVCFIVWVTSWGVDEVVDRGATGEKDAFRVSVWEVCHGLKESRWEEVSESELFACPTCYFSVFFVFLFLNVGYGVNVNDGWGGFLVVSELLDAIQAEEGINARRDAGARECAGLVEKFHVVEGNGSGMGSKTHDCERDWEFVNPVGSKVVNVVDRIHFLRDFGRED